MKHRKKDYRQASNSMRNKFHFELFLVSTLKPGIKSGINEDVVGAAPKGDALTTCYWSTILLPTSR